MGDIEHLEEAERRADQGRVLTEAHALGAIEDPLKWMPGAPADQRILGIIRKLKAELTLAQASLADEIEARDIAEIKAATWRQRYEGLAKRVGVAS